MPIADTYAPPPEKKGGKKGGKSGGGGGGNVIDDYFEALSAGDSGGGGGPGPILTTPVGDKRSGTSKLTAYLAEKTAPTVTIPSLSMPGTGAGTYASQMGAVERVSPEKKDEQEPAKKKKSYEMSQEDYDKLNDKQRAAVDFNTLLIQAREKDLNSGKTYAKDRSPENLVYRQAVSEMFGPAGGSKVYAPEVMALLRQVDYTPTPGAKRGDDLDDFLELKTATRAPGLDSMDDKVEGTNVLELLSTKEPKHLEAKGQLAEGTEKLQKALDKGHAVLKGFGTAIQLDRKQEVAYLGGTPYEGEPSKMFDGGKYDADFKYAFDVLANSAFADRTDELLGAIRDGYNGQPGFGATPGKMEEFTDYVQQRAQVSEKYQLPLGENPEIQYLNPADVKQIARAMQGATKATTKGGRDGTRRN